MSAALTMAEIRSGAQSGRTEVEELAKAIRLAIHPDSERLGLRPAESDRIAARTALAWMRERETPRRLPCLVTPQAPTVTGDMPIEELWPGPGWREISARTVNALHRGGYAAIAGLASATAGDLSDIRNLGAGCLAEVWRVLAWHGLTLAGEEGESRG